MSVNDSREPEAWFGGGAGRLVFGCAVLVLSWLAFEDVGFRDAGELGTAAAGLGIAHPTGFGVDLLVLRALGFLPLGHHAFRQNLMVAWEAAAALGLLAELCDAFPEIHEIGGVRPDPLPWHPNGLALDVIIPNPGTPAGIALGNEIVAFAFKNAVRFGLQDAIWRGVYYTPSGPKGYGAGHFDHVHVTTY